MDDQEKAVGRAHNDEKRLTRELQILQQTTAEPIAKRLKELLNVVQTEDPVDSGETIESLVCPLKHDVADLLRKRADLTTALKAAQDFLQRMDASAAKDHQW